MTRSLWVSAFTGAICHFRGQNIIFREKKSKQLHALPNHSYSSEPSIYSLPFISVFNDSAGDFLLTLNQSQCYYLSAIDFLILLQDFSFFFHYAAGSRVPTLSSQHSRSSKAMKAYDLYFLMKSVKTSPPIIFSIKSIVKLTSFSSGDHLKSHRTN